jgi:signal transduction histidine kinase
MRPRTLRSRLAALTTALIGAISVFIFLSFPKWLERGALQGQVAKAHSIASMTAFSVGPALVFQDKAGFEEGFDGARRNPDLVYLLVRDSVGAAVAGDSIVVHDDVVSVSAPIESGGRTIGRLHLGMSLDAVRADVRKARAAVAVVSLLVFLVGMVAVLGISAYVTRPLDAILATVERIAEGDRSQRAPVSGSAEIANMARAFNRMVDSLDAARLQLEESNRTLEARVTARTEELKVMQDQFVQVQKMEAVGQLAAGVAHDFNNLLTSIIIGTELSLSALAEQDPIRVDLDQALLAANRGKDLTRQLLAFGRKQMLIPRIVDVDRLVAETHLMLRRMIGEDIELRIVAGQHLWAVKADPSQLQQVIMNLVVNARDAMPQGGTLWIETANAELDESIALRHPGMTAGCYVLLSVRDTGGGMDDDVCAHLFEPFFTTKGPGKGSGLGLATVYGIVKQSGGYVLVDSAPGAGATFRVYLPRAPAGERAVEPERTEPADVGGTETVLVVEDDLNVRAVARRVLVARGYQVLEADNGADALESVARSGKPDLLLTDVVMPGMSGLQLAREMLQRYPDLKVICVSGYAADVTDPRGGLPPGVPLLQKPYTGSALSRAVRRVLDGFTEL